MSADGAQSSGDAQTDDVADSSGDAHPDGDSQSVERSFGQSSSDLGPVWGDNEEFLEDESGENYMNVPTPLVSDE